ncbi:chromate transporter [Treponema brennaborense]|uniref:Chromate transporter n=1 Tax=Treponema brennaborense (strain DSM 12168 / CIP 105900 / DD5/3) TaxID=906968 RepID=F4LJ05_TREBD|nr:chromate transporter [Treponema brennaborense]AEE17314.1 Chromate transporter [Treponema brennaborense DSM 12168]
MSLLQLMWVFFYVGLFTIGGGLVAITLMYDPIVGGGLISSEQFYHMVAISESTPGPIGINMATYIGCELYGVWGGIATTAATVLPSLICIIVIAKYFGRFQEKPLVKAAFTGLRPAVSGMVAVAAVQVFVIAILDIPAFKETGAWLDICNWPSVIFYAAALAAVFKTKIHPIAVIAAGAVFGALFL